MPARRSPLGEFHGVSFVFTKSGLEGKSISGFGWE
jgi:hypothetical protein